MSEHKYGRPRRRNLDQEAVDKFLVGLGFKVETITQEWRHLLSFGKYQGEDAVFKLASTQATSPRTQNEYEWNEAVHLVPEEERPNFTVPKNFASGYYGKLFYFIAERFLGNPLVDRRSNDMIRVNPKIHQIAQATHELEHLPIPLDCAFAQTKKAKHQKQNPIGYGLLNSAKEWASQVPRELEAFLSVLEESKEDIRTCVGHGDFVVRQMYEVKGKIGIIDGEHAGIMGPLYYDVAQFYIRLRNDHDSSGLSREYLKAFRNLLSATDQETFWKELKPVLIQRYIGDLWGAARNPKRLKELEPLGNEILNNKVL